MLIMNLFVVLYLICVKEYFVNFVSVMMFVFFYLFGSVLCICCVSMVVKFICLMFYISVFLRFLIYLIYDS